MALFLTIDEFKQYVAIDKNAYFATFEPYILQAETIYMRKLLGDTLFDALQAEYTAGSGTPASPEYVALLPYVQQAEANYACYLGFTAFSAHLGDRGVQVNHGEMSSPAPKWLQDRMRAEFLKEGDRLADALLAFLETNSVDYASWANSPSNTVALGYILQSALQASDYIEINESRRIWLRLLKYVKTVESKVIMRLVCQAQYDALVAAIKAGSLTADETALVDKLRPIVAKMALYEAIPTMRLQISVDGLLMYSTDDSTIKKEAADQSTVQQYRNSLRDGLSGYNTDIDEVKQFVEDNIDTYPLIKASTCYTSKADPGPKHEYENLSANKHFSV